MFLTSSLGQDRMVIKFKIYDEGVPKITTPEYNIFSRLYAKKGGTASHDALSQSLFLCLKRRHHD